MEYAACNVVYVDRTAHEDRLVSRDDRNHLEHDHSPTHNPNLPSVNEPRGPLDVNLRILLGTFSEVHVCTSGKSCIAKLSELNQSSIVELIPTLVLIDIPYDDQLPTRINREVRTPSPSTQPVEGLIEEHPYGEGYGLSLLQWITTEIQYQSLSRLVVPVAVVAIPEDTINPDPSRGRTNSRPEGQLSFSKAFPTAAKRRSGLVIPLDQTRTMRYLDLGAVDVLTSPLLQDRLPSLAIHAYRAHKDASKEQRAILEMKRGRKRSWVGVDESKPYAYLREAMVSGLMDGICKLGGEDEPVAHIRISIALDRRDKIAAAVGSWQFSAHEFTDDELLHASLLMLQHALAMPELEKWRISTENLTAFLVACRSAYNAFVPYHNFRHVVDVLQASFHFLVQLGRIPQFPASSKPFRAPPSPIAALIRPFDALALLITAIGHDVGHPGVNNGFLVTLNAPLAQLYNDRSVLESFHCAAYSQILRRHWPAAFQGVEMRQLMISSILATDMQLHFDYMTKLGFLQEKLHENGGTDGWNGRMLEEQRTLACSLLIKCADISNVARKYHVAAKWTEILIDEFARQAAMEQDLGIPSALFAAPVREIVELGKSQIGFMNMFAIPLFQGVTDVMPGMAFAVDELQANKLAWQNKITTEQARLRQDSEDSLMKDGMFSPRSMSLAHPSDASHQKLSSVVPPPLPDSSDLRKLLLTKDIVTPANGAPSESDAHHHSVLEIPSELVTESKSFPLAAEPLRDYSVRATNPATKLQPSFAATRRAGVSDPPSDKGKMQHKANRYPNGVVLEYAHVPDSLIVDSPITQEVPYFHPETQRSSDGTDGSNSATGDWTSQVNSATTSKMPLSPSTKGTSILSDIDSSEKHGGSPYNDHLTTPTGVAGTGNGNSSGYFHQRGSPHASEMRSEADSSDLSLAGSREGRRISRNGDVEEMGNGNGNGNSPTSKGGFVMDKVRSLKKKPSRFRMNFWKRSKSASPPLPSSQPGVAMAMGNGSGMAMGNGVTSGSRAVLSQDDLRGRDHRL